jgi:multiple sugar transport system permease protein
VIFPALFRAFAVFLLVQTIRSIPDDYLEAARLDGAGLFRTYWQVVMPLCAPTLATLCITTFMDPGTTSSGRL